MSPLTMQGFLEPLHTDHVFSEFEGFAVCLKAELPTDRNTTSSHKMLHK